MKNIIFVCFDLLLSGICVYLILRVGSLKVTDLPMGCYCISNICCLFQILPFFSKVILFSSLFISSIISQGDLLLFLRGILSDHITKTDKYWYIDKIKLYYYCFQGSSWSGFYGSWINNYLCKSVPITTKVMSSKPVHGEVYWIQHYAINFVSDLRQIGGFLWVLRFPQPIKRTSTI